MTRATTARALAAVPIALTLMPLSRTGQGWVRIWDFPRAQIAALGVAGVAALLRWSEKKPADQAIAVALGASMLYQASKIAPYTPAYRRQVPTAHDVPAERCLKLFMANVLQENRRSDLMHEAIARADPDIICLVETDRWWAQEMASLAASYRWGHHCPLDNHYGMLLYSRLPITACDVRFAVTRDVPSIRALIRLRSGDEVVVYALHPPPPLPNSPSYGRDAELVLTGLEIHDAGKPAIVIGDLNDVAWSYTTKLFQRVSQMVDPRVGRGMFSTFHARHPLARYPLDHVFHTTDFTLRDLRRLPYTGSDHFPISVELAYTPQRKGDVQAQEMTPQDLDNATEMIEDARQAQPYVDADGNGAVTRTPD
jgi:endonuclease/exonuclease/phosphatase (EEP) superfamily protein YafD